MNPRTHILCAPLLLACPRPTDYDKTDDGAGDATGGSETGPAPAPAPVPAPAPRPSAGACDAEIQALKDATAKVEACVDALE